MDDNDEKKGKHTEITHTPTKQKSNTKINIATPRDKNVKNKPKNELSNSKIRHNIPKLNIVSDDIGMPLNPNRGRSGLVAKKDNKPKIEYTNNFDMKFVRELNGKLSMILHKLDVNNNSTSSAQKMDSARKEKPCNESNFFSDASEFINFEGTYSTEQNTLDHDERTKCVSINETKYS